MLLIVKEEEKEKKKEKEESVSESEMREEGEKVLCEILVLAATTIASLQAENAKLSSQVDSVVMEPLRQFSKTEISLAKEKNKECLRIKSQYENLHKEVEANKNNRNIPQEKKQDAQQKLQACKAMVEEGEHETLTVLSHVDAMKTVTVGTTMLDYLDQSLEYHQRCVSIIEAEKDNLQMLKETIAKKKSDFLREKEKRDGESPSTLLKLNCLFGVELGEVMVRENETGRYPEVVRRMIDWIGEHGLKEEGIFRIPGTQKEIDVWTENINMGKSIDQILTPSSDAHLICSLLKQYLRNLPEPLCGNLVGSFLEWMENEEHDVQQLRDLFNQLDPANYFLLKDLMVMCEKIVAEKETNKMSSRNLSLVMSATVFSSSSSLSASSSSLGSSPSTSSLAFDAFGSEVKLSADLFCFLIENQDKVFVGRGDETIKRD
mmetsp:Transcript_9186/g.13903  ORF Transcript_9186/g.13903 Transcript_9186/m.13903 type:complete len:433 (-) Transcript_9186:40-1338(-)